MPFKKGELPLSAVAKRQRTQRIKEFKGLSREQRKELLKETWQETAYTVALRASTFARFCNAREGGRLYQLIMAGAVSMDKAFPPKEQLDLNEVVNLFGSLGARGKAIVQPNVPQIEAHVVAAENVREVNEPITITPEEEPCLVNSDQSLSPVSSLPPAFGWPDAINSKALSPVQTPSLNALTLESLPTRKSASKSTTKTKSSLNQKQTRLR